MRASSAVPNGLDLVVFSAAGREELLAESLPLLRERLDEAPIAHRILALDGLDPRCLPEALVEWFDRVVYQRDRRGYHANIVQGVAVVEADLFLWLEDDWELRGAPLDWAALAPFANHPDLAQLRWPKNDRLLLEDRAAGRLGPNAWAQRSVYSLNPHVARTEHLRRALADLRDPRHTGANVEVALSQALRARGRLFGVWEPTARRALHRGRPEATDYAAHRVEAPSAGVPSPGAARPSPRAPGGARLDRALSSHRGLEWAIKPAFASAVTLAAAAASPFSRQARAYVRHVWRYWLPALDRPEHLGPTREDARSGP